METGRDKIDLAAALRALRKAAGLSGQRLADKIHTSQSKISKIETGAVLPSVADVEHILRALEVAPEQASSLLRLARAANVDFVSRRQIRMVGVEHKQREIASLIERSHTVKHALPAMLPGILQTRDYMAANVHTTLSKVSEAERPRLIAAKLERSRLLQEGSRDLTYLLTEAAVRTRVAVPAVMARQLAHLVEISALSRVSIALLPLEAIIAVPLLSTFAVYDDRLVIIETTAGPVSLRDPADLREHLDLFDHAHDRALKGNACRERLRAIGQAFQAE